MNDQRTLLDGQKAMAFHHAFDRRQEYISREQIHLLVDGEEQVPLPGCPECGSPGRYVMWAVAEGWITLDVDPCGHRLRVARPVVARSLDGCGGITVEEWLP